MHNAYFVSHDHSVDQASLVWVDAVGDALSGQETCREQAADHPQVSSL